MIRALKKIVVLVFFLPMILFGKNVFVDLEAVTGKKNGHNWKNAYINLQDAMEHSLRGDTIFIAKGTYYTDSIGGTRDRSFVVKPMQTIIGGFANCGTLHDYKKFKTVLSGDFKRNDRIIQKDLLNVTDNAFHVISAEVAEGITIDGVTICDGYSGGESENKKRVKGNGGGCTINAWNGGFRSMFTLKNCCIKNCVAEGKGAGAYICGTDVFIQDCEIISNSIKNYESGNYTGLGGGLYVESKSLFLTGVTFSENHAVLGGGLTFKGEKLKLENVSFNNNSGRLGGGALSFAGISMIAEDMVAKDNFADGGKGGAIYYRGQTLEMEQCSAERNAAAGAGGAIDFEGDSAKFTCCTFTSNVTSDAGGAFRFLGKHLLIDNTLFSKNDVQRKSGGAFCFEGNSCLVFDTRFKNNKASLNGGAISFRGQVLHCTSAQFNGNLVKLENGGAIDFKGDSCFINQSIFQGNVTEKFGGAMSVAGKQFKINDCIFNKNIASEGGALFCELDVGFKKRNGNSYKGLQVHNSTFADNSAKKTGGAITWLGKGEIRLSKFVNNSAPAGTAVKGLFHAVGSEQVICDRTVIIDSARYNAEVDSSGRSSIIKTSFIDSTNDSAILSDNWCGKFDSCSFGFSESVKSIKIGSARAVDNCVFDYRKINTLFKGKPK